MHVTADGVLVAFHDDRLDRVTDRRGAIADLRWSDVREARIGGEHVPRFEELLEEFPLARFNVDMKSEHSVIALVRAIRRQSAAQRICIASFSSSRLRRARALLGPEVCSAAGPREISALVAGSRMPARLPRRSSTPVFQRLQVPVRHAGVEVVTPALLRRARALGCQVHVWTIDEPQEMHRLLDLGVDGIMTRQTFGTALGARGPGVSGTPRSAERGSTGTAPGSVDRRSRRTRVRPLAMVVTRRRAATHERCDDDRRVPVDRCSPAASGDFERQPGGNQVRSLTSTTRRGVQRRRSLAAGMVLSAALVAAACGGGSEGGSSGGGNNGGDAGKPIRGGTIVYGVEADTTGGYCLPEAPAGHLRDDGRPGHLRHADRAERRGRVRPVPRQVGRRPNDDFTEWTITAPRRRQVPRRHRPHRRGRQEQPRRLPRHVPGPQPAAVHLRARNIDAVDGRRTARPSRSRPRSRGSPSRRSSTARAASGSWPRPSSTTRRPATAS